MARRGRVVAGILGLRAAPFILAALLLHVLAFIIWDVGSRSPTRLLEDLRSGLRSGRVLATGLWRFVLGLVVLVAGGLLMLSVTLIDIRGEFTVLEAIAIVTGLTVEMLVGATIRAHIYNR